MEVKCYRKYQYGSANIDVDAHMTLTRGFAILNAIKDRSDKFYGGDGTSIRLDARFEGTEDRRCEAVYILGGRKSIVHWLRLQGENPSILNDAGSGPLWMYHFRKHRTIGKDSTLVMICPWRVPITLGGWQAEDPIDLRYCLGSNRRRPDISPERLATILANTFAGVAA
jgi:hypothetical protein